MATDLVPWLFTAGLGVVAAFSEVRARRAAARLDAERRASRNPQDDDVLAYLEASEAAGSELARRLLASSSALVEADRPPPRRLPGSRSSHATPQESAECGCGSSGEACLRWDADGRALLSFDEETALWVDLEACRSNAETMGVIERWHDKGYVFPLNIRRIFLSRSTSGRVRDRLRALFDEQDGTGDATRPTRKRGGSW